MISVVDLELESRELTLDDLEFGTAFQRDLGNDEYWFIKTELSCAFPNAALGSHQLAVYNVSMNKVWILDKTTPVTCLRRSVKVQLAEN